MKHNYSNRLANNAGYKPGKVGQFANTSGSRPSIEDARVRIAETLMNDTGQLSKPRLAKQRGSSQVMTFRNLTMGLDSSDLRSCPEPFYRW